MKFKDLLANGVMVMCIKRGFMVGLGNNGFNNPIISCCLEVSSAYNPFTSKFPFPAAIHHHNVCSVDGLNKIPPLLPPGNYARVQTKQLAFIRIKVI